MPLTTFTDQQVLTHTALNANFAACVLTDSAKTISVTHTWSASQTFSGGVTGTTATWSGNVTTSGAMWVKGAAVTVGGNEVSYGGRTQTTVGSAGGASALPATPRGYIIVNVAGTDRVFPFYDKT